MKSEIDYTKHQFLGFINHNCADFTDNYALK